MNAQLLRRRKRFTVIRTIDGLSNGLSEDVKVQQTGQMDHFWKLSPNRKKKKGRENRNLLGA